MHQMKQSTGGAWLAERFHSPTGWVGRPIQSIYCRDMFIPFFLCLYYVPLGITLPYTPPAQTDTCSSASPGGSGPLSEGVERGIITEDWRGGL